MVYAFTAVDAATGVARDVCEAARECEGVLEASVISGEFDVMVELEGSDPHDILSTITGEIRPLDGVGTTRTYICLDDH
ncbi:Lrp/AsnC family transcriptional regulator [Natrarchaeobius oligotrophus]|uniref:Lrp/AsnC family transcriptional regulator n=1 Tax=Natrarchaeobius chitinivorans TaxID=1679083 RepID=A0A3N6PAS6_NATCH|nr:Lrp/AsnC ligand binding domain-containing protein [Natrarchaeobius chitinivorans]RQG96229.1 Lrp/AsnC family transcriptional regulator [Natrarchaeobius chitinivorans]